jgi:GcrA cell cycle regulator
MPRQSSWTPDRVQLLTALWSAGETAVVIGVRLGGLSRSAVLGKVFRLRLPTDNLSAKSVAAKPPDSVAEVSGPARRRQRTKYKKRPQPSHAVDQQHKTLFELTNNTCRWPHGRPGTDRFFFCGALEADLERGIPYCAQHMRRAYPTCVEGEAPTRAATRLLHPWR